VRSGRRSVHRILLLIDHLDVGGAQRHVFLLASRLVALGHRVAVAYTGAALMTVPAPVSGVQLSDSRVSRAESPRFSEAAVRFAQVFRPTVIHAHLFASALAGAAVSRSSGVPLLLSHHSIGSWQQPADRARLRSAMRRARFHFAASPQIQKELVDSGVPASATCFLPNAIDVPERPVPRPPPASLFRAGYLARFSHDKDPVTTLEAVARARSRGVPVTLEMAGSGELKAEVDAATRRLDLEDAVELPGFLEDVPSFFSRVDALMLSSRSEGMPLAVMEAMAHEVPVIATRVGAVADEVRDRVTGLLVQPGDIDAMSGALGWMQSHPDERQQMGVAGRQHLFEAFSLDRLVARVVWAYDQATAMPIMDVASAS
jgi:glycosyltransferase involved in cell wall biosynthesis